jgi:anti-sigma B factor antagonist
VTPGVPALRTTVERSEAAVLVCVQGELDLATAPALERALLDAAADGPVELAVDVSGVGFVDATGLGALLRAAEAVQAAGGSLRLTSPSRMLRLMLRLLELEDSLPVVGQEVGSADARRRR